MNIERIIFYALAALALSSAGMMIMLRNPIKALLCLALVFLSNAVLWILLRAEFLSMILVLVYVGAIMVLFLFMVMMIKIESAESFEGRSPYFPLGIAATLLMSLLLVVVALQWIPAISHVIPAKAGIQVGYSLQALGLLLYSDYLYPLMIAGVILLVAMIAAIRISLRKRPNNKAIDPSLQMLANKANRLRIIPSEPARSSRDMP